MIRWVEKDPKNGPRLSPFFVKILEILFAGWYLNQQVPLLRLPLFKSTGTPSLEEASFSFCVREQIRLDRKGRREEGKSDRDGSGGGGGGGTFLQGKVVPTKKRRG